MIKESIGKLAEGHDLSEKEMYRIIGCIMDGEVTNVQIAGILLALKIKGETVGEILGCARAMMDRAVKISPGVPYCIDTCGTGGDHMNSYNISTASAIVAAAGGACVAKHGNRSASSRCGSADVLEALGVSIRLPPDVVRQCIEETGIGFLFAPDFHASMKNAAIPRKELGLSTIFNIAGPVTNPADAGGRLIGVFSAGAAEKVAIVLLCLGIRKALVLHGLDGMDEITVAAPTLVFEINDGRMRSYEITPEDFGFDRSDSSELAGGDALENAQIIAGLFAGRTGPKRDALIMNAAAALYVGEKADNLKEGAVLAEGIIDSGLAAQKLDQFATFSCSHSL